MHNVRLNGIEIHTTTASATATTTLYLYFIDMDEEPTILHITDVTRWFAIPTRAVSPRRTFLECGGLQTIDFKSTRGRDRPGPSTHPHSAFPLHTHHPQPPPRPSRTLLTPRHPDPSLWNLAGRGWCYGVTAPGSISHALKPPVSVQTVGGTVVGRRGSNLFCCHCLGPLLLMR